MRRISAVLIAALLALLIIPAWHGSFSRVDPDLVGHGPVPGATDPRMRQNPGWVPPRTRLPATLVEVAATLFAQGFGDPRNCEYSEVEFALAAKRPGPLVLPPSPLPPMHAWVIPSSKPHGPRLAVAWNGLVYSVKQIGARADLDADVHALLDLQNKARSDGSRSTWNPGADDPVTNLRTASQSSLTPAKVILLLRLGRADLAEAVWRAGTGHVPGKSEARPESDHIWYLGLASAWAWAIYERAATAHSLRDDAIALRSLRELARIQPLIETQAAAYQLPRSRDYLHGGAVVPYLSFLEQMPAFLADQTRRASEPKRELAGASSPSDRRARIARLIRDLDEASPAQAFVSTHAVRFNDPPIQALVKEGGDAVEPLLQCLEQDDRLTRSLDHDHLFSRRWLHIYPVYQAAHTALCEIIDTREFGSTPPFLSSTADRPRRKAVAAEIRAYWESTHDLARLDRFFRILADDTATPAQWLDAAEALAQPSDVHGRNGVYATPHRFANKVPPLRGEPLRDRVQPSLTELMVRRAGELDPGIASPVPVHEVLRADRMAGFLAAWDPTAARQTLASRMARCIAITGTNVQFDPSRINLGPEIGKLTLLRVKAGDAAALHDYAGWIRAIKPPERGFFRLDTFEPLWTYADHEPCALAANALFGDDSSRWVPLFRSGNPRWFEANFLSGIVISPLMGLAPFRKQLVARLTDRTEEGTICSDAVGQVEVSARVGWSIKLSPNQADPLRPQPNVTMKLRRCDPFAWKLQHVLGLPRFEFYWPESTRDRTINVLIGLLHQYGERFQTSAVSLACSETDGDIRHERAVLTFARLDRPAAPGDVAAGRSIFSLAPAHQVRTGRLPAFPITARWTALQIRADDPDLYPFDLERDRPHAQIEFLQRGRVWQAEEVCEDGRWQRYYGYVGRHVIAKIPATDIDFPATWNTGWFTISRDLDGRLLPPGARDDGQLIVIGSVSPGVPLPVIVTVRNHRGIVARAPVDLYRSGTKLALRDGVSIRVFRRPEETTGTGASPDRGVKPAPEWPEVFPCRQPARHSSDAVKSLEPAETAELLHVDLRDLFDLSAPGMYRVEVAIDSVRTPAGDPGLVSGAFRVEPPASHSAHNSSSPADADAARR